MEYSTSYWPQDGHCACDARTAKVSKYRQKICGKYTYSRLVWDYHATHPATIHLTSISQLDSLSVYTVHLQGTSQIIVHLYSAIDTRKMTTRHRCSCKDSVSIGNTYFPPIPLVLLTSIFTSSYIRGCIVLAWALYLFHINLNTHYECHCHGFVAGLSYSQHVLCISIA